MKLLPEQEEHHLPDSAQALKPWHIQLLRRFINALFSNSGMTVAVGVLLTLMLSGIIGINYLDISRGVDKNGISLMDAYADFHMEIVDKEATQRKIDRTKQTISPIYQEEGPHNKDIGESLDKRLDDLGILATDTQLPQTEKYARFQQLVGGTPNADVIFERYFRRPISEQDWQQVTLASQTALQHILKAGFTEADEQLRRDATIRHSIPRSGYSPKYRDMIYFALDSTLQPNLILDEPAMRHKQEEVAAQINQKPEIRTFNEKQKIVGIGEKVGPVEMAALERMGKTSTGNILISCLGVLLMSSLFVFTLWSYLYNFRSKQFFKPAYAALISALVLVTTIFFHLQNTDMLGSIPPYALPLATVALTLAIFTHPHVSVLTTTLLIFLLALTLEGDFQKLSVLLFGSYMGIYILGRRIHQHNRGQLIYAGFYVGITNAVILMAIHLMNPSFTNHGPTSTWMMFGLDKKTIIDLMASFASGVFSGILTIGSLPLLETLFRLITPYTLMELGNHDQPLLKRMQFEAPGTFHHSLMVATLAEAAAEAVEANALLTRVGCLYHDIGKMKRPLFFIENQAYFGVENPHDKLTPRLSKMVITAHPRDSIEMAKQHKLPEILMKFMTEHHGTLTAGYFYNKACIEEGMENVNKSQFRYPGPKPSSKETAIVMLADACESAVRALKTPSVAQVEERIDKIIQQRVEDGQFDNCPITFQDIYKIKQTFVRVLRGIQHNRIEYQQNMMRELGRKLPVTTVQEHSGLQDVLKQAQDKSDKGQS